MRVRAALVATNPKKPESERVQAEVESFLLARGVRLSRKRPDLLITIGGDGTLLWNKEFTRAPVFGIGSAHSFLCQATMANWRERLEALLAGFRIERRAMLAASLNGKRLEDALNEFVVRAAGHRVLAFELCASGTCMSFRADGLIFSTPTGSSAYAYSSGGIELPPHARCYEIVAIAPYRRAFEYAVLSDAVRSTATVVSEMPAFVAVDGQFVHPFEGKAVLRVWKSSRTTDFAIPEDL
ncbi:MAG: hypothetical protein QXG98_05745 [Candidatus Micrarchaeia archaeon]